jgi:DNA polymerase elongation subunit (family B)
MAHIDLMKVFVKRFAAVSEITSWSLEFISQYFLGHGKMEGGPEFGDGRGYEYYKTRFEDFKKYNIADARNLWELNDVLHIVDQVIIECQICGAFPSKFSTSELIDCFVLRTIRGKGVHFNSIEYSENQVRCPHCNHIYHSDNPIEEIIGEIVCMRCGTKFEPNSVDEDIEGAYVFDPETGIHDNVYVFDYKALYPSIIRTWNIGPDSLLESDDYDGVEQHDVWYQFMKSANGQWFNEEPPSAIKIAVERLLNLRKVYKNKMGEYKEGSKEYKAYNAKQNAVKVLCNSVYGQMGYQYGRFYRKEIAEAITLGGQWLNKQTKKWFEDKGYTVIYGDTDSVFVKGFGESSDEVQQEISDLLIELHDFYDESLKENFNVHEHHIELEYEKRFARLLLMKKKHYVGQIDWLEGKEVDKFIVKGLECIKRDTISLAKKWQRELVEFIIKEDHPASYYVAWMESKMDSFFKGDFELDDIIIWKKLTKHPTKYKTANAHANVAIEMIKKDMKFHVGMQIPYIVIEDKPIVAVHPDWYENNASIDYYWDQKIHGILKRVLEVAFPSVDWDQYSTKIRARRKKKRDQFIGWFNDPKKKRDILIKKLAEDKVMSAKEKTEVRKKAGLKTFKRREITLTNNRRDND